jgi:chemotaxis response regulator CheB
MRKMITRKMTTSKIYGFIISMENGNPKVEKLEPITIGGKVSEIDGLKALKNKYGKTAPIMVEKIETFEDVYEISVEDFLKYATKVTEKEVEKEEEKKVEKSEKVEEKKVDEKSVNSNQAKNEKTLVKPAK